ncbi:MAG TPA: TonB-dependent receptor [Bryobacteraceae bacterium]|nr:TonB-dependent receptor [Bryobacteraceae bacterium]
MKTAPILLLTLTLLLRAQTPLGTVTGLATDPSGALIPGASVALTDQQTDIRRSVSTNASGVYVFPDLPPGTYRLSAEARHFRPVETRAFPVEPYRTVRQDLHLELAASSSSVVVTEAASPVVDVDTPALGSSMDSREIIELPTNLRSVAKNSGDSGLISEILPETVPGVVQVGNGAKWLTPGAGASSVKVKVDGIETTFGNFGSPDNVSQPSMEAIQEFTAVTLTGRAEFGGMGTVTVATRSGSNEFHGGVWWYMHNSATDARNTFATSLPFVNLHNYGGRLGGPVQKGRTFFFADFDGARGVSAYLFSANVPTLAMRQGDFTGFTLHNPLTGASFPSPVLPSTLVSPQALAAQNLFFPLPNYGPPTLTAGNYRAAFDGPEVHRTEEVRIDHQLTRRQNAFLRYENRKDDYQIPGARSALPPTTVGTSDNIRRVNFWTLGDVDAIRPNLLNEIRVGAVILVSASNANFTGQSDMQQIGISGLPNRGPINSLPFFSISGFSNNNINLLSPVNDGHAQFADNLTWIRGRHTMKFGAEETQWFINRYMPNNSGNPIFGSYSFTGTFSGNAYADFLLGLPATVTRQEPYAPEYNRARDWAGYAQDDFKATPRLTLMYGLRYEYNGPAYTLHDNLYSFDLNAGKIVVPSQQSLAYVSKLFPSSIPLELASQAGLGRSLRHGDPHNFAPRLGFSYQLDASARTVVRGGWGVYWNHYSENVPADLVAGPYAATTVNTNTIANGQPAFTLANPFATPGAPGTLSLRAVAPDLHNSYALQYTLSLEREVTRNLGVRVSYIGSKGTNLAYRRDVNEPLAGTVKFSNALRPFPLFNSINYADNGANMLYSGLQTQVEHRFGHGLEFTSTWTWAKEISDTDDTDDFELNTTIEDSYNRARDRGNVYSVPRHEWLNQGLYELPFGRGKLLGGWELNLLLNLSTGNWFTPLISGADPTNTNTTTLRPNLILPSIPMPRTVNEWFNPAAFGTPANGQWGNAGRGIIEGPGYILFNLGLQKTVKFERIGSLQFIASFQNVLNHPNLGEPSGGGSPLPGQVVVNNANGGKITATAIFPPAGSARTGEVALRWSF